MYIQLATVTLRYPAQTRKVWAAARGVRPAQLNALKLLNDAQRQAAVRTAILSHTILLNVADVVSERTDIPTRCGSSPTCTMHSREGRELAAR